MLVILHGRTDLLVGKALNPAQNRMVRTASKHPALIVGNSQRDKRRVLQVKRKARFRLGPLFLDQTPENLYEQYSPQRPAAPAIAG